MLHLFRTCYTADDVAVLRPHYAFCSSICLSVCLFICLSRTGGNSKSGKTHKDQDWCKRFPGHEQVDCQFLDEKVKGEGHRRDIENHTNWRHIYLFTYGRPIKRRRIRCRLQTRPLLGLIYCRRLSMKRSETGRTAAYHVGTRRRHVFF